jgi:general secretion pathway protein A
MYKSFYRLKRNPFDITPDPSFLFSTKRHNEALAALYYGVRSRKGFVVLTGEVGTGKTLLLRCLLKLFEESKDIAYAYLFNSRLSPMEFLQYVATDFGLSGANKNKSDLLLELSKFVVSRGMKQLTTVLIVDEAHDLSADVLEEIRLLTNLETMENKLLQILVVGQPELDEKLDSVGLRQLKQRVSLRARLEPLDFEETKGYIERRLQLAAESSGIEELFPPATVAAVYRRSRGIPRLINTVCENALLSAYAKQMPKVTPELIDGVADDLRLDVVSMSGIARSSHVEQATVDVERIAKALVDFAASRQKSSAHDVALKLPETQGVRPA